MPRPNSEPVTLDMVAEAAGVWPSTVSRIVNGTAVVSEVKKQAVEHAIVTLGLVPNPVARGLAGGRTLSVGVVTQSIDGPFYGVALRGIEDRLDLCSLAFDNFEGARLATHHLLALGHQRVACIGGDPAHPDAVERQRGCVAALTAAGITPNPELMVSGLFHEESGLVTVGRLLDSRQRHTAIFAANDQMALGACLGLHRRGMRVPQDVPVVGFFIGVKSHLIALIKGRLPYLIELGFLIVQRVNGGVIHQPARGCPTRRLPGLSSR